MKPMAAIEGLMFDEEDKSVLDIYWSALQVAAPGERAAYLDRACNGNGQLRRKLDRLMASQTEAEKFFKEAEDACRQLLINPPE